MLPVQKPCGKFTAYKNGTCNGGSDLRHLFSKRLAIALPANVIDGNTRALRSDRC